MTSSEINNKKTPFKYSSDIHNELKIDLQKIQINGTFIEEAEVEQKLDSLYEWISSTPKNTTYRVNLLKTTTEQVIQHLNNVVTEYINHLPSITTFPHLPEVVIVQCWDKSVKLDLLKRSNEVIVDAACGSAVLRGSHIFAPGILGMPHGLNIGDVVSVYADTVGSCKKGLLKTSEVENKMFLGNGILKQTRESLFCSDIQIKSGIAVYMTEVISRLPQLNVDSVPDGWALLQNLPSIICTKILNPQPGEIILDMCSAPGNKSTHISALMNGQGTLIALEKNKSKLEKLKINCNKFSSSNVKIFCYDSTKACDKCIDNERANTNDGPPFKENSFDRILLDSPCSALGQRPQLLNKITVSQLRSYVPLQRKLFSTAVQLLKPNGILVYSTCTVTIAENEGIVSWALKTYPYLKLKSIKDQVGLETFYSKGYSINGLTEDESEYVLRIGPESDTVGFFIACFTKQIV